MTHEQHLALDLIVRLANRFGPASRIAKELPGWSRAVNDSWRDLHLLFPNHSKYSLLGASEASALVPCKNASASNAVSLTHRNGRYVCISWFGDATARSLLNPTTKTSYTQVQGQKASLALFGQLVCRWSETPGCNLLRLSLR